MMQILRLYPETVYRCIAIFHYRYLLCFFCTLTGYSAHSHLSPVMKKIKHPIV